MTSRSPFRMKGEPREDETSDGPTAATNHPSRLPALPWVGAVALLVFALGLLAIEVQVLFWEPQRGPVPYFGDLNIYRSAISYWLNGGRLYDYVYVNPGVQGQLGFTYPPFAALVLLPTAWIPMPVLAPLWTAATYALVAVLAITVARRARDEAAWTGGPQADFPRVLRAAAFSAALLLLSSPVFHDIGVGEITLAITTLALLDTIDVIPGRFRGVLLGVAAALKLTPLVFVPYLLLVGRRREASVAAGAFVTATAIAFVLAPQPSLTYWGTVVMDTARVGQLESPGNKSLMGLLARWGASGHTMLALWLVLGLGLSVLAVIHGRRHHQRGELMEGALVVGALSVVLSPISWPHHQTWAVLAGIWLVLTRRPLGKSIGVALLAIFCLVSPLAGQSDGHSLALRVAEELPTLAFIAITATGLGRARRISCSSE